MRKENCYWIINVGEGRKYGYSFCVKTLETVEDWPCNFSRYVDDVVEAACKAGLFRDEKEAYGCGVQGPFGESDWHIEGWKEDAKLIEVEE